MVRCWTLRPRVAGTFGPKCDICLSREGHIWSDVGHLGPGLRAPLVQGGTPRPRVVGTFGPRLDTFRGLGTHYWAK